MCMKIGLTWQWRDALFGLIIALPGMITIANGNIQTGISLLIGMLAAAAVGLLPTRHDRRAIVFLGVLFGLSILAGSLLAQSIATAVFGLFGLSLLAVHLARKSLLGALMLSLCLPLAGIGLSYTTLDDALSFAFLITIGSLFAYLVSLCFPEFASTQTRALPKAVIPAHYGVHLGLTAATAAGIGFWLNVDHVGWIVGTALLVIRPTAEMQRLRSIGRVASVFIGALLASWLITAELTPQHIALVTSAALVGMAATHTSYWYVTAAFTTFLVFWMLLSTAPTTSNAEYRFIERTLETLVGVSIAYFYGIIAPSILNHIRIQKVRHAQ